MSSPKPQLNLWDPSGRREPTPPSCPVTPPTGTMPHIYTHTKFIDTCNKIWKLELGISLAVKHLPSMFRTLGLHVETLRAVVVATCEMFFLPSQQPRRVKAFVL